MFPDVLSKLFDRSTKKMATMAQIKWLAKEIGAMDKGTHTGVSSQDDQ